MLAPILVLIETVSYITQVISFGLRLAANISAGHCNFIWVAFNMLSNGLVILSLFPMFIMVFITLLDNKEYPVLFLPFSPGGIPINEARGVRQNMNNSFVGSTSYSNTIQCCSYGNTF